MRFPAKKHRQRMITTGVSALALLTLSACFAPPATLSLRPPASVPVPPTTAPLAPLPEDLPPVASPALPTRSEGLELPAAVSKEPAPVATAASPEYYESSASYYAKRFNGRRTFTGERYDPNRMTAATRDFPLHSWLKVINPANGREVNVRINDLTGKRKTPLIDLSRAAAKKLNFIGKGKIHAHVIPILPTPVTP